MASINIFMGFWSIATDPEANSSFVHENVDQLAQNIPLPKYGAISILIVITRIPIEVPSQMLPACVFLPHMQQQQQRSVVSVWIIQSAYLQVVPILIRTSALRRQPYYVFVSRSYMPVCS